MRREGFLLCLISAFVSGAAGILAGFALAPKPTAPTRWELSRGAHSQLMSLMIALDEYRHENGRLPSHLRSLYPGYYLPLPAESLERQRSRYPGRPDFVYIPVRSAPSAVLVAGDVHYVFTPLRDVEAHFNRGVAHQDEGRHDLAIKDYTKAIELKPGYAKAWYSRGVAYSDKGRHDLAIKDYSRAAGLAPGFPLTYVNRARAYLAQKDYGAAWADVKAAQRLGHKVDPEFLAKLREASGREE